MPNGPVHKCTLVSVGDLIVAVDGELVSGKVFSLSQLAEKVYIYIYVYIYVCIYI